jgi:GntR family transcriptional regulator / MocR family aminotransferase
VLARLVEDGRYDRHLRRVRRAYRERRDVLVETLAEAGLDDRIEGVAAGMQAVLRLDDRDDDRAIVDELHRRGVEVVALSRYTMRSPARGLVIGFGQASPSQLRQAATIAAEVVGPRLRRGERPSGQT